jgi:hypothetical protein
LVTTPSRYRYSNGLTLAFVKYTKRRNELTKNNSKGRKEQREREEVRQQNKAERREREG